MANVQYKHIRFNKQLHPMLVRAVTVAVTTDKNGKVFIGAATCSAKDNFSRETGRELSFERLEHEMKEYNKRSKKVKKSGRK